MSAFAEQTIACRAILAPVVRRHYGKFFCRLPLNATVPSITTGLDLPLANSVRSERRTSNACPYVANLCLFHGTWCCGCRAYYTPNASALSTASMLQLFHAYRRASFLPVQKGSKDTPEGEDSESAKVLHFPSIAGQMEYKMSCPPDSFAPLGSPHSNVSVKPEGGLK